MIYPKVVDNNLLWRFFIQVYSQQAKKHIGNPGRYIGIEISLGGKYSRESVG
jgi:hypothetical protein